jgi:plasmid maintenance system killer protein
MIVEFRTTQLRRAAETESLAIRRWGPDAGRNYVRRVIQLRAARSMADLYDIRPLRFHALTGDQRGQYAVSLTGRIRLVLEQGPSGETLVVVGVEDYHE